MHLSKVQKTSKMNFFLFVAFLLVTLISNAQQKAKPEETEVWTPVPKITTPAKKRFSHPPPDAIILFDGKDLSKWVLTDDTTKPADWKVANGNFRVNKKSGNIQTRQSFHNYQLHLEWRIPKNISGSGQSRGNSGLFMASIGKGDLGYELQILDSYNNLTYVNGQSGSIYKQYPPLVNANLPPGEWQQYDVIWTAPAFNEDGSIKTAARVTAFFNGILIQNNVEVKGTTVYIGKPYYQKHGTSPIKLQAHGDPSEPISFRNIWVRPL